MTMHQGNWKCSKCGGAITELPFEPRSESGLTCRECWKKDQSKSPASTPEPSAPTAEEMPTDFPMDAQVASEPMPSDDGFEDATPVEPGEKKMFEGEWECAGCGDTITKLPFKPNNTSGLKCLNCYKQSR